MLRGITMHWRAAVRAIIRGRIAAVIAVWWVAAIARIVSSAVIHVAF